MRFEYKYRVPIEKLAWLREALGTYLELDANAESGQYTVRSIYFDTPHLTFYHEKIDGVPYRRKLRWRGYDVANREAPTFLEIKQKHSIPISKNRSCLPFDEAHSLLLTEENDAEIASPPASSETFLCEMYRRQLQPVVLTVYERAPYVGRVDRRLRVTLDLNLRSAPFPSLDELYSESDLRPVMWRDFVLEIKFDRHFPAWLRPIIGMLNVRQQSVSKYCLSIENHGLQHLSGPAEMLSRVRWN